MGRLIRFAGCVVASCLAFAAEWPGFRGPDANPTAAKESPPAKWSKTVNVEWFAEIPGRGWSSPIVSGNKVFLTTVTTDGKSKPPQKGTEYSNEYAAELMKQGLKMQEVMDRVTARDIELPNEVVLHYYLYCLDLQTGRVSWKQEFFAGHPPGGRHRKNSFASETPVTDGKAVYIHITNLGLYAYDMAGKQLWHRPMEAYPIYLDFGTGGSPVLWGNMLLIVNDNEKHQFIAAFDAKSGEPLWRTDRDLASSKSEGPPRHSGWATPFVWHTGQRTEVVTVGPGTAVSYDAKGKELWRLGGMSGIPIPSPFAYDGLLYVNGGRGTGLFAIKPGATGDLTAAEDGKQNEFVAWSQPRGGTYLPTEVAYDGALYVLSDTGILSRFDAKTGKLSYRSRIEGGEAFTSSPWAYDGKVFCLNEEGQTFVIAAGEKYEMLHVNPLDEMAQATPAIVGDRLLLRTETRLYSIRSGAANLPH
ncbi:MAG TPA: PQQ-binding-like beta-propeller repeat protein [Bryobacteraceae bacterium]|nr:PQQ-binding-like beta-propeller repeat protein [Bryobacteraceae bacterium]